MHHSRHLTHSRLYDCLHRLHRALAGLFGRESSRRGAAPYVVPGPPDLAPAPGLLRFFDSHEARTIEALTDRIFPAGDDGPGARDAGVVDYIDYLLAQRDSFAQPMYRRGPFAVTYHESAPPIEPPGEPVVWVEAGEVLRYGFQSPLDPKETYRQGVAALDRHSLGRFGAAFADLTGDRQDEIVDALANDLVADFDRPTGRAFFQMVQEHTIEGLFSDPQYGGNREMIGWRSIGFPGAQRAYAPEDLTTEDIVLEPQSLARLHAFHPRMDGSHPHPAVATPMPLSPREGRRR